MTKFLLAFLIPALLSCAANPPRVPASSKPKAHVACTTDAECSGQACEQGICAPHTACSGPADCEEGEACWTGVGCIPARCATSKDCYQGATCRSNGWCGYGE